MHPIFFHFGHVILPTFGVLAAAGLLAALSLSRLTAILCGLSPEAVWDAGLFAVFAAFFASRLLLLLTNLHGFLLAPLLLLRVPSLTAGGLLLTVGATAIFLRRRRMPLLAVMDAWSAPGLLLWAALAMGHLAEGSDPGLPAARFGLRTSLAGYREQPVALYVALAAFALAAFFWGWTRRPHRAGHVASLALWSAGAAQFSLSFLRLPYLYLDPTPFDVLDPIEWVALLLMVFGALVTLASGYATGSGRAGTRSWSTDTPGTDLVRDELAGER